MHIVGMVSHDAVDTLCLAFGGFDRFISIVINGAGKTLDQHLTNPRHFLGGRMDAEEATDAVPDGGDPPGHLVPQPGGKLLNALPQATYKVATHLCKLGDALAQGIDVYKRQRLDSAMVIVTKTANNRSKCFFIYFSSLIS